MKISQDATDKDGKPIHVEWTGKFDGKDYPVTGNPAVDTRSYKKTGKGALTITNKKRRQSHHHSSKCYLGGWQDPHGARDANRFQREKGQLHRCVRQGMTGPAAPRATKPHRVD